MSSSSSASAPTAAIVLASMTEQQQQAILANILQQQPASPASSSSTSGSASASSSASPKKSRKRTRVLTQEQIDAQVVKSMDDEFILSISQLYLAKWDEIIRADRQAAFAAILHNRNGRTIHKELTDEMLIHACLRYNAAKCIRLAAPFDKYNDADHLATCPLPIIADPSRRKIIAYMFYNRGANLLRYDTRNGDRYRVSEISYRVTSLLQLTDRIDNMDERLSFFADMLSRCPFSDEPIPSMINGVVVNGPSKRTRFLDELLQRVNSNTPFSLAIMRVFNAIQLELLSQSGNEHATMVLREQLQSVSNSINDETSISADMQTMIMSYLSSAVTFKHPLPASPTTTTTTNVAAAAAASSSAAAASSTDYDPDETDVDDEEDQPILKKQR